MEQPMPAGSRQTCKEAEKWLLADFYGTIGSLGLWERAQLNWRLLQFRRPGLTPADLKKENLLAVFKNPTAAETEAAQNAEWKLVE